MKSESNGSLAAKKLFDQYKKLSAQQISDAITSPDNIFDFIVKDGVLEITGYNGNSHVLDVPQYIDGLQVEKIGENAFAGHQKVRKVTLPYGLREIGAYAFSGSTLSEIHIPEGVVTIGEDAFRGTNLKEIIFPSTLDKLSPGVCCECEKLRTAIMLGGNDISFCAFNVCDSLKNLALPETLEQIQPDALPSLKGGKIIIPKSVRDISTKFLERYGEEEEEWNESEYSHVAILNDEVQWKRGGDYPDFLLATILYCNYGSTTHAYAKEHCIECHELRDFSF